MVHIGVDWESRLGGFRIEILPTDKVSAFSRCRTIKNVQLIYTHPKQWEQARSSSVMVSLAIRNFEENRRVRFKYVPATLNFFSR